jgi:large subunit ribosomal protein L6
MSRIGNNPITIPEAVTVTQEGNVVKVKGNLGELYQDIDSSVTVSIADSTITLVRNSENKSVRSLHGLYRALIANMIKGVTLGHSKKLELRGVGYRASTQGQSLDISVGYSHNIIFDIPSDLKVVAETEKGKSPVISISGIDKQLVGAVAARIRLERKPEPYKGKGIRYVDEYVRKKAGKTAAAK